MVVSGSPGAEPGSAQHAADRLALALEEIGFDVGRTFPALSSRIDAAGVPVVELGRVTVPVAESLAVVLSAAAELGVTAPGEGG